MNTQDRQRIQEIIADVKEGHVRVIDLEEFGPVMFRNIYNEAMLAHINLTILKPGKSFQVG